MALGLPDEAVGERVCLVYLRPGKSLGENPRRTEMWRMFTEKAGFLRSPNVYGCELSTTTNVGEAAHEKNAW